MHKTTSTQQVEEEMELDAPRDGKEQTSFVLDNTFKGALALQRAFVREHVALLERLPCHTDALMTPQQIQRLYVEALEARLTQLDILLEARRQTAQEMNKERRFVAELSVLSETTQLERLRIMLDREHQALTLEQWRPALYKRLGVAVVGNKTGPVSPLAHPPRPLAITVSTENDASVMEVVSADGTGMQSFCQFHAVQLLGLYLQTGTDTAMQAMDCATTALRQQLVSMETDGNNKPLTLSLEHCRAIYESLGWTQERARRLHKTLASMRKLVDSEDRLTLDTTRELLVQTLQADEDVEFFRPLWQRLESFIVQLQGPQQQHNVTLRIRAREIITTLDVLYRTFETYTAQATLQGIVVHGPTLAEQLTVWSLTPQRFHYKTLADMDKQLEALLADWSRNVVHQENVGLRVAQLLVALSVTLDSRERVAQSVAQYFQTRTNDTRPEKYAIRNIILQYTEFY
jgi:hypothetical protein